MLLEEYLRLLPGDIVVLKLSKNGTKEVNLVTGVFIERRSSTPSHAHFDYGICGIGRRAVAVHREHIDLPTPEVLEREDVKEFHAQVCKLHKIKM
jgi:hypothetical protein